MNKLITSVLATSVLFTGVAVVSPHADAATSTTVTSKTVLKMPDMSSAKVVKGLKAGTYTYKGIKPGNKFSDAKTAWGSPQSTLTSRDYQAGTWTAWSYGKNEGVILSGTHVNRSISTSKMIIEGMDFSGVNESVPFSKVKAALGKPTNVERWDNYYIMKEYGPNLIVSLEKTDGVWYVSNVDYHLPATESPSEASTRDWMQTNDSFDPAPESVVKSK